MLIILYGQMSDQFNWKQQRMINGGCTCGYREYAKNFGHIVYLSPQKVKLPWEHSITDSNKVIAFIKKYPKSVVWSVKHDSRKDREILAKIDNKKLYYSCNSKNRYNKFCDVSLVDTEDRLGKNAKVWFKGKDPNYWLPGTNKEFDYLLMGRRGDKNEVYFINRLREVKEKRRVLWIGGEAHRHRIKATKHDVIFTDFSGQNAVRTLIPKAKVGILFTELSVEGFPQSYLEMTMCGIPVVYNKKAPGNKFYFHKHTCIMCSKQDIIQSAEFLLQAGVSDKCREEAIKHYSLKKSYNWMLKCLEQ